MPFLTNITIYIYIPEILDNEATILHMYMAKKESQIFTFLKYAKCIEKVKQLNVKH